MTGTDKPLSVDTGIRFLLPIPADTDGNSTPCWSDSPSKYRRRGFSPSRSLHPVRLTYLAPQSPQEKLEKFFDNRPSPTELKQRNILKDSNVAPALQSAQAHHPKIAFRSNSYRRNYKGKSLKTN